MISYIGGKSRIAPKLIVPNISTDIENFIEVFGGMFWTFFSMDLSQYPNLKKVIYNDFNPLNYNLFKCVQNPSELQRALDSVSVQQLGVSVTPQEYKDKFVRFQTEIFVWNPNEIVRISAFLDVQSKLLPNQSRLSEIRTDFSSDCGIILISSDCISAFHYSH